MAGGANAKARSKTTPVADGTGNAGPKVPFYRRLAQGDDHPTLVVAGADRRTVWLYVHDRSPTILRLRRPVVGWLRWTLPQIDALPNQPHEFLTLELERATGYEHPRLRLVANGKGNASLYVHATTVTAVPLPPAVVGFLHEQLANLPAEDIHNGVPASVIRLLAPMRSVGDGGRSNGH
jgi:hypothetical protein